MNSFNLSISGSWLFLVLIILIATGFSFYSYRKTNPELTFSRKMFLFLLRTFALALLLFVLFEPVFLLTRGSFDKPVLAILLDNSLSMSLNDQKSDRKQDYEKILKKLNLDKFDRSQIKFYRFSDEIREIENFNNDSLNLKGQLSDLSKPLKWVNSNLQNTNFGAVLLVSDGCYNSGQNPVYEAEMTGRKIYSVGIGDTSDSKDILIQSIITNDIAYIDNPVPVNVNVKISGYKSGQIIVKLSDNNTQISEQQIIISPDKDVYSLLFQFIPKNEGIRKLTASIIPQDGELTQKNNTATEFINVLKNKRKIIIFSGNPNPDITFIRNIFESEKGVDVKTFIQKQGAEFFEGNPSKQILQDAELIVLIGFPISSTSSISLDLIKDELQKGKPCLFVASQYLDYNKLKLLEDFLPFNTLSSKPQEFLASGDFRKEALSNSILKITSGNSDLDQWNKLPPIFRTETFVKVKPESEVLAGTKVNNTPLKEPLILTRNFQNKKSVAVLGYGLYRWKLLGYAADIAKGKTDANDLFSIFLQNSHRWLSVNQENKNVIIKSNKKVYNQSEKVEFIGQIYDLVYNPVDNANVVVKFNQGSQTREITLNPIGNGRYSGFAEGLPEGDYFFAGEAKLDDRLLGKDNGRFSVGDISIEYLDLKMNSGLLRTLTDRTGGKFYTIENAEKFQNDLKIDPNFKDKAMTIKKEYNLWNLSFILGLAVLVLSIEWFVRKRSGLL